jgi:DNA-binding NarL/FixJ family response regulator
LRKAKPLAVCIYSFHPLVLAELDRLLSERGFRCELHRLDPTRIEDVNRLPVPSADAYIVEANTRSRAAATVLGEVLYREPSARLIVIGEEFDPERAFPLHRIGAKGLLRYSDIAAQLIRAIREVAIGGFWVPRALLANFVDSTLAQIRRPRLVSTSTHLSRREKEVHDLLMENLSNKEIAARLAMSERTVKFHVSNLLSKHRVKRRADLILLSFSESRPA